MPDMRTIEVYDNLSSWDYDIGGYRLSKAEADCIIKILKEKIEEDKQEDDLK